jgi:hypothetical protein
MGAAWVWLLLGVVHGLVAVPEDYKGTWSSKHVLRRYGMLEKQYRCSSLDGPSCFDAIHATENEGSSAVIARALSRVIDVRTLIQGQASGVDALGRLYSC